MAHDLVAELEHWTRDFNAALHNLTQLHLNPFCEAETIMSGIDDLKALSPRLDAIKAKAASANSDLTAQVAQLQGDAAANESTLEAVVSDITGKVGEIETTLGIGQPATGDLPAEEPTPEQPQ